MRAKIKWMLTPIEKLTVQITKTADGQFDYLQILSGDQFSLNVVLIAKTIEIRDQRPPSPEQIEIARRLQAGKKAYHARRNARNNYER